MRKSTITATFIILLLLTGCSNNNDKILNSYDTSMPAQEKADNSIDSTNSTSVVTNEMIILDILNNDSILTCDDCISRDFSVNIISEETRKTDSINKTDHIEVIFEATDDIIYLKGKANLDYTLYDQGWFMDSYDSLYLSAYIIGQDTSHFESDDFELQIFRDKAVDGQLNAFIEDSFHDSPSASYDSLFVLYSVGYDERIRGEGLSFTYARQYSDGQVSDQHMIIFYPYKEKPYVDYVVYQSAFQCELTN